MVFGRKVLIKIFGPTKEGDGTWRMKTNNELDQLIRSKGKGKAVPLQAWTGPEGSKKLRFSDFMTTAQDGGKVVSLRHRSPLPPGNTPGTHFC